MQEQARAGFARVVMARRERMILLEPLGKGLLATILRYPYEVRGEDAYFDDIPNLKLPAEMKKLAGHIIETKAADFDPTQFEDRYEKAVVDLIQSKQSGRTRKTPDAPKPSNVVNLMDTLRKSVDADRSPKGSKKAGPRASARRSPVKASAKKSRTAARSPTCKAS